MRRPSAALKRLALALTAAMLVAGCSDESAPHPSPTTQRTSAIASPRPKPPASRKVMHCATMKPSEKDVSSCASQARATSPLPAAHPMASLGDFQWDPTRSRRALLEIVHWDGMPAIDLRLTRALRSQIWFDRHLDPTVGAHYVDLWAAKHGMAGRDVMMQVPQDLEPLRIEWDTMPTGTALHAGPRVITRLPRRGAVVVVMPRDVLEHPDLHIADLCLLLPDGQRFPLPI